MNTNVQILDNYNDNVRYCFVIFFSKTVGQKKTWPMAGPNYDLSTIQTCLVPLSKGMDHVIIKMND